jgi:hypothetical protein
LEPVFVEFIPPESTLEPGKIYVSMKYNTAVHLCASGCGLKVVLPLSRTQYHLRYDGATVSFSPSVGNWEYPCRAHYWIRDNRIEWAADWSQERVEARRAIDEAELETSFATAASAKHPKRKIFGVLGRSRRRREFPE